MGEYLSTPNKTKETDSGENEKVRDIFSIFIRLKIVRHPEPYQCDPSRSASSPWACRDGASRWKTRTLHSWTCLVESQSLASSTAMAVSFIKILRCAGTYHLLLRSHLASRGRAIAPDDCSLMYVGQEVALFVKEHFCKELEKLKSF